MNVLEIQQLIDEYNDCELAQQGRLRALLREMHARKGYREVVFTGDKWSSNQFGYEVERVAFENVVNPLQRFIKSWKSGEE